MKSYEVHTREGLSYDVLKYSQEDREKAMMVSLTALAKSLGYIPQRIGKHFCLKEMDSLVIYNDKSWHRWSGKGTRTGGSQIDFMLEFGGASTVPEAIQELLIFQGETNVVTQHISEQSSQTNVVRSDRMMLPPKNSNYKRLYAYLMQTRGLSQEVVSDFVKRKLIYEDSVHHNIVYCGYDPQGNIRYAGLRGTADIYGKKFKMDVLGNDKNYGVNIVNKDSSELNVFESVIDCMSYIDLNGDTVSNKLILGMVEDNPLVQFLKDYSHIKDIIFCLDNDAAAKKALYGDLSVPEERRKPGLVQKYTEAGYGVDVEVPMYGKDYNETLIAVKSKMLENEFIKKANNQLNKTDMGFMENYASPGKHKALTEEEARMALDINIRLDLISDIEDYHGTHEDDYSKIPLTKENINAYYESLKKEPGKRGIYSIYRNQAYISTDYEVAKIDIEQLYGIVKEEVDRKIQKGTKKEYISVHSEEIETNKVFLFRTEIVLDREGNYFDGEDPYRQYEFQYFSVGEKDNLIIEKQIFHSGKKYQHDEKPYEEEKVFLEEFANRHQGKNIVVLSLDNEAQRNGAIQKAFSDYKKYGQVYKILNEPEKKGNIAADVPNSDMQKISAFKAKTEQYFHEIDGLKPSDIEKMVANYIEEQIREWGLDIEIVDMAITGSRSRGFERDNSDIDVVVEYQGDVAEDSVFCYLNEISGRMKVGSAGCQIDINPIKAEKTGTLAEYLTNAEKNMSERKNELLYKFAKTGDCAAVAHYIELGANVNYRFRPEEFGNTALSMAAYLGDVSMINLLLAAGADINLPTKAGKYPLDLAIQRHNRENVVSLLRSKGAFTREEVLTELKNGQDIVVPVECIETYSQEKGLVGVDKDKAFIWKEIPEEIADIVAGQLEGFGYRAGTYGGITCRIDWEYSNDGLVEIRSASERELLNDAIEFRQELQEEGNLRPEAEKELEKMEEYREKLENVVLEQQMPVRGR